MPFLLNIASALITYIPSFPFAPRSLFSLLRKLDLAFASLLQGIDVETKAPLPASEAGGRKVTMTEKVRLRAIVEGTRVLVIDVAVKGGGSVVSEVIDETETVDTEPEMDGGDVGAGDDWDDWQMQAATVYERTLVDLGQSLNTTFDSQLG